MLRVRSTDREIDIEGTSAAYEHLRRAIIRLITKHTHVPQQAFRCKSLTKADTEPYTRAHSEIRFCISAGQNAFDCSTPTLLITGSHAGLRHFADNFPDGGESSKAGVQYHHHYDYISFPDMVSENSPAITLSLVAE